MTKIKSIKNLLIRKSLFKKRLLLLEKKKDFYDKFRDESKILDYQINKFNEVWKYAQKNISFYKKWQEKHNLPKEISSIEELRDFPSLTKKDIQVNKDLIFSDFRNCKTISTGGSTGEPTKFPTSKKEGLNNYANTYMARGWWGIKPLDNFLIIWGHSHLFGSGIKGKIKQLKRSLADWLINVEKLNAYDMSVDTLDRYYEYFLKSNPNVLLGYTSTMYKLAKYIKDNQLKIGNKSRLKGVIITSETVTETDIKLFREVFKVPVIIEYGLAETGNVGYSKKETDNIEIFWDSLIAQNNKENILHLTTIKDKLFPLINYRTDDLVTEKEEIKSSILTLSSIKGRTKDIVNVKTVEGSFLRLSGILVIHILKSYPDIYGINFEQLENGYVKINIVSDKQLNIDKIKNYFMKEIKKDHKNVDSNAIILEQVDKIKKTKAGKER